MRLLNLGISLFLCSSLPAFAGPAPQKEIFMHNGSTMMVDYQEQTIRYLVPKRSLPVVSPQMSFAGRLEYHGKAEGIAYVYKRGCGFVYYDVKGHYDPAIPGYVLTGAAPVRAKRGCDVIGYTMNSPNSRLIYVEMPNQEDFFGDL